MTNGDQDINKKRKSTFCDLLHDDDFLTLSLAPPSSNPRQLSPARQPFINRKRKSTFSDLPDDDFLTLSLAPSSSNPRLLPPAQQPFPSPSPPMPPPTPPQPPQPQSQALSIMEALYSQTPPQPQQERLHLTPTHPLCYPSVSPEQQPLPSPAPAPPPPQPQECSISTQEIFSQTPPQGPLQLATSLDHPLHIPLFSPADSSVSAPYQPDAVPTYPLPTLHDQFQTPGAGKGETVPAPFPWSTDYRAKVHSLEFLISKQIFTITGKVQCKKCEEKYEMGLDLRQKFLEVGRYMAENKNSMNHRAPRIWTNPILPTCKYCGQEKSVKPVVAAKKKKINWLFLLLGQMLGCCTLEQLKYFCKHNQNHRTGAKDRVLFLTYLGLCKQLDPDGPFDL